MMATEVKIYAKFGAGSVSSGCYKVEELGLWCVSIKPPRYTAPVGTILDKNTEYASNDEIILAFPTESQMISVMAALLNKSFEVVYNEWKAKEAEKSLAEKEVQ